MSEEARMRMPLGLADVLHDPVGDARARAREMVEQADVDGIAQIILQRDKYFAQSWWLEQQNDELRRELTRWRPEPRGILAHDRDEPIDPPLARDVLKLAGLLPPLRSDIEYK